MEPYLRETFYPASYNNRKADYLYIISIFVHDLKPRVLDSGLSERLGLNK